jgi:hypothetical protein
MVETVAKGRFLTTRFGFLSWIITPLILRAIFIYTESPVYSTTLTYRPRKSKNRNSVLYSTANYRNPRYTARNGGVFISGLDRYLRSTLCSLKILTTPQHEPQKIKEQITNVISHIVSYFMKLASPLGSQASRLRKSSHSRLYTIHVFLYNKTN